MNCRKLLSALALLLVAGQALAQGGTLLFAVNEGVTYRVNPGATAERFREVSEDLSKLLKRPVKLQSVTDYKELSAGLAEQRYDLAYVHPAHHAIRAMAKSGYSLLALTKGFTDYRASFLVRADSPLKTLADLRGQKIGAPDEDSITSVIMRATLRDALGTQPVETTYVKLQDAVPFMVEHGMAAAGVSASRSVVKAWQDNGGKVLATSKPVPIKYLLASSKLSESQRALLTNYFVGLEQSPEGKKRLEALNVPGFVEFDQNALVGIGKWLGI
jgi:ABC-type phosphate/phosphonate transport system substrate-binding protein